MKFLNWFKFLKNIGKGTPVRDLPSTPSNLATYAQQQIPSLRELKNALRSPPKYIPLNTKRVSKIKIAVDESIGAALARRIEVRGYEIVARAGHAETDESWMKRALKEGALFIVSPDLDIPSMIERENLPMVWIDFLFAGHINPTLSADMSKGEKHEIWSQYIHDRIQSKLKFLGKEFGGGL